MLRECVEHSVDGKRRSIALVDDEVRPRGEEVEGEWGEVLTEMPLAGLFCEIGKVFCQSHEGGIGV